MEIPTSEVIRYLGYRKVQPEEDILRKIGEAEALLKERIRPRTTALRLSVMVWDDANVQIGGMEAESRGLCRNLQGCREAYLMAATLGPEADILVRRAMVRSPADGAVMQAAQAAMIEAVCDAFQEELRQKAEAEGLVLRPRFSPGYGDFALEHQRDFERLLHMSSAIGVTLTESLLMVPTKSVTAVIGLSPVHTEEVHDCSACMARGCAFRREV